MKEIEYIDLELDKWRTPCCEGDVGGKGGLVCLECGKEVTQEMTAAAEQAKK